MSMNVSQYVTGHTHKAEHTLDLLFLSALFRCELRVMNSSSSPLSWLGHFLLRFKLSAVTSENGLPSEASWC